MGNAVEIFQHFETPKAPGVYYRLICLTGDNKGKAYFLTGKRVVMGRSEEADVTILDMKSSREHAEIISIGRDYIITDLGSQNGVVINDLKIKQHTLSDGDKIIIGKTVYKFSKVEVKETAELINKSKREGFEEESVTTEKEDKKLNITLIIVVLLGVFILFGTDSDESGQRKRKRVRKEVNEVAGADSFSLALQEKKKQDKMKEEKLNKYFHRGLREYREGNYFRALEEFQSALASEPGDLQARNFEQLTKEKLNEQIQLYFSRATRDIESVKYAKAAVSYCTVVRLLVKNQNDERYKSAKERIKSLEEKMGLEEGEIKCSTTLEKKIPGESK